MSKQNSTMKQNPSTGFVSKADMLKIIWSFEGDIKMFPSQPKDAICKRYEEIMALKQKGVKGFGDE